MKYTIISVRDIVANAYSPPTFHQSKGSALRSFSSEVNRADENNTIYKHPNDYELYALGTYEDETATFEIMAKPEQIGLARDYKIS
ncbi:MAG: nonstructural protein [Microvirus sp.]|nr:MAG: nonstructural protein [Microvirus sp.]